MTMINAVIKQATCPHKTTVRMDPDHSRMCNACGLQWNPNVHASPNDVLASIIATIHPDTATNGEAIADVLGRAYQFDNKPHLLFNGLRLLAEKYAEPSLRDDIVRLMNDAYNHIGEWKKQATDLREAHSWGYDQGAHDAYVTPDRNEQECKDASFARLLVFKSVHPEWTEEIPTEPGRYWFYGWRWQGERNRRDAELSPVVVKLGNQTLFYITDGAFWYPKKECDYGLWKPIELPVTPDLSHMRETNG